MFKKHIFPTKEYQEWKISVIISIESSKCPIIVITEMMPSPYVLFYCLCRAFQKSWVTATRQTSKSWKVCMGKQRRWCPSPRKTDFGSQFSSEGLCRGWNNYEHQRQCETPTGSQCRWSRYNLLLLFLDTFSSFIISCQQTCQQMGSTTSQRWEWWQAF